MTLLELVETLRRRWITLAAGVVAGLVVAGVVVVVSPTHYTAQASVYLSVPDDADTANAYQALQLAQQRAQTYLELTGTDRVDTAVSQRLGGRLSPAQVDDAVSTTVDPDSVIVVVTATTGSPTLAAATASTTLDVLTGTVAAIADTSPRNGATIAVRPVETATPPSGPSSPDVALILLAGLVLGALVGVYAARVHDVAAGSRSSGPRGTPRPPGPSNEPGSSGTSTAVPRPRHASPELERGSTSR